MDDPKNLYWENFLKMFQNGPIRKVIMKKVIFEDFLIFSPAIGHPGSTLRKISDDFFKKHYGHFIEIGVSDRLDIAYSQCFDPFNSF